MWLILLSGILVSGTLVYRTSLLFVPNEDVKSEGDDDATRFSLLGSLPFVVLLLSYVEKYHADPEDYQKSLKWILAYYFGGEISAMLVLTLVYPMLPTSSVDLDKYPLLGQVVSMQQDISEGIKSICLFTQKHIDSSEGRAILSKILNKPRCRRTFHRP